MKAQRKTCKSPPVPLSQELKENQDLYASSSLSKRLPSPPRLAQKLQELLQQVGDMKALVEANTTMLSRKIQENNELRSTLQQLEREGCSTSLTNQSVRACSCSSSCSVF